MSHGMSSKDLVNLGRASTEAIKLISEAASAVRDQPFMACPDEATASYLASVKGDIYLVLNALHDLCRRAEAASRAWAMTEKSEAHEMKTLAEAMAADIRLLLEEDDGQGRG